MSVLEKSFEPTSVKALAGYIINILAGACLPFLFGPDDLLEGINEMSLTIVFFVLSIVSILVSRNIYSKSKKS